MFGQMHNVDNKLKYMHKHCDSLVKDRNSIERVARQLTSKHDDKFAMTRQMEKEASSSIITTRAQQATTLKQTKISPRLMKLLDEQLKRTDKPVVEAPEHKLPLNFLGDDDDDLGFVSTDVEELDDDDDSEDDDSEDDCQDDDLEDDDLEDDDCQDESNSSDCVIVEK